MIATLLTEDQSEYVASILSRCAELPGLMWDLDNIPLSGKVPKNPSAIASSPRAFVGAAHYIDPALRAFAAIHGLPMPVTWA